VSAAHVLITCRQMQNCFEEFREQFEARGITWEMPEVVQQPTEDELIEIIGRFDGMIAGDDPLTARVLEHAGRLRILSKWGIGTDGIDKDAAERLGIPVTNTPGVFGGDVADVAMGYVILLARQLHRMHQSVVEGGWFKWEGIALDGKRLGIAGFGSIGQAVARRAQGFGMETLAFDVMATELGALAGSLQAELVDLDELFRRSEVLVLCCPLTAENRHMVNQRTLELMQPGSFVINVARGPLVDERALADALAGGGLSGAALDVFEEEPLPAESPLRAFDSCVFGSHNASNTREGVLRASEKAVANLLEGLERQSPRSSG
jgi:D-3-phosphoglycerate dehydrogenase